MPRRPSRTLAALAVEFLIAALHALLRQLRR